MKKILVTGGAGYIGSHCIIALIASGYQPIVIDNFSNSSKSVFQKLKHITKQKIKYYHFDLREKKNLAIFLNNIHFMPSFILQD